MNNKVLLMILDGWGIGNKSKGDVIYTVGPEYYNSLLADYPNAQLLTDGENVGLPEGQMGNSEVGHLNIGAGRVVYQDLVKINRACRDNSILENKEVKAAFEYAKEKGVGIFLWMHWRTLQANGIDATFAKFAKWGIAGVKIDYMNRMDQEMVQWYEKVVKSAAKHKLIVNYHGSFVPTGTERTWPNNLTRESVLGNEMNKFNARCNPRHHATLPFTRFILGAADFTPGGFDNLHSCEFESQGRRGHDCLDFSPSSDKPKIMAQEIGTRAHALALTVAYDSPLMTLCDLPERYRGQRGVEALRSLPTVWRNTKVVSGEIGSDFALVRETFDGAFYFAAISVKARRQSLDLSFLGNGEWEMTSYSDDPLRSTGDAKAISINARKVTSGETVFFDIVDEGGAVAIFRRVEPK